MHDERCPENGIEDGDLVLIDVGCELHGYVSDLTPRVYSSAKQLEGETKQPRQQAQTAKPTKTRKTQKGNITRSPPKPKAKQQSTQKPGDYKKTPAAQTQNTKARDPQKTQTNTTTAQKRQQKSKGTGESPATTAKRGKRYSHQLITSPEPAEQRICDGIRSSAAEGNASLTKTVKMPSDIIDIVGRKKE
ncbi:hypothetical protein Q3G72_030162 [Acer saccharum]|nr:hypothetical protein Q3G72_030162 [Acer saccharum]